MKRPWCSVQHSDKQTLKKNTKKKKKKKKKESEQRGVQARMKAICIRANELSIVPVSPGDGRPAYTQGTQKNVVSTEKKKKKKKKKTLNERDGGRKEFCNEPFFFCFSPNTRTQQRKTPMAIARRTECSACFPVVAVVAPAVGCNACVALDVLIVVVGVVVAAAVALVAVVAPHALIPRRN
jgi:hypothetical protein